MIAFPHMLIGPAQEANMPHPPDPEHYDEEKFMHFQIFKIVQLGRPMPNSASHCNNAKVIASARWT